MDWLNLILPNQTVKNGLKAKKIELPQINSFLEKTTNKVFMCLLAPFILQNFKKNSEEPIQSYEDVPFLGPKWSVCPIFGAICPEQEIFGKNHYYYFGKNHYLPIGPFHCVRFKNILTADPIMRMYHFWTQNGPFAPNQFFFLKIIDIILIYILTPFIERNF